MGLIRLAPAMRLLLVLLAVSQLAAECPGTETGNPGKAGAGSDKTPSTQEKSYSNGAYGVATQYDSGWSVKEQPKVEQEPAPTPQADGDTPRPSTQAAPINTANAASTVFTDGATIVTLYYVTLNAAPPNFQTYLQGIFPSRTFVTFSNGTLSGFKYDNPEAGTTGGDRQEYYFLKGTTLLYIITDLFSANDGDKKFNTLLTSLKFE